MEVGRPTSDDSEDEEDEEDDDSAFLPVRRPLRGRAPGKHFSQRKAGPSSSGTAQQNSRGRPPKRQSHRVAQASRGSSSDEIKETWTQKCQVLDEAPLVARVRRLVVQRRGT